MRLEFELRDQSVRGQQLGQLPAKHCVERLAVGGQGKGGNIGARPLAIEQFEPQAIRRVEGGRAVQRQPVIGCGTCAREGGDKRTGDLAFHVEADMLGQLRVAELAKRGRGDVHLDRDPRRCCARRACAAPAPGEEVEQAEGEDHQRGECACRAQQQITRSACRACGIGGHGARSVGIVLRLGMAVAQSFRIGLPGRGKVEPVVPLVEMDREPVSRRDAGVVVGQVAA